MIIKLRDKTEIVVSKERGEKLSDLLISGECPDFIQIDYITISKNEIAQIKPGGIPERLSDNLIEKGDYRNDPEKYKKAREKVEEIREKLFKNV